MSQDKDSGDSDNNPKREARKHSKLCEGIIMCNDTMPRWVRVPSADTKITLTLVNKDENNAELNVLCSRSGCMERMTVLGRGKKASIYVDSSSVSRIHAGFLLDYHDHWFVVSLSKSYPTFLNGKKLTFLQPTEIANGAEFVFHNIGPYEFCAFRGSNMMGPPPPKKMHQEEPVAISPIKGKPSSEENHTDAESKETVVKDDGVKIRCSHILVKHKDSRNPSSWKQEAITRTREEAISYAKALRQLILAGSFTLQELAATESDCMTHKNGGDVNWFGRGDGMHKAFEDTAFALKVGEMSNIVETPSGIHIILRTK